MAPTDAFDLCAEYLAACEAAVATAPGGTILRAYVSPGPPPFDCAPQLTVHAGGPAESDTAPLSPPLVIGERTRLQGAVFQMLMTATVIRCAPVIDDNGILPTTTEMEAAAVETISDVWAIWNFCRTEIRDGTLFASPSGRREVFFDPAIPVPIEGGTAGWSIPVRVQLDGYSAGS